MKINYFSNFLADPVYILLWDLCENDRSSMILSSNFSFTVCNTSKQYGIVLNFHWKNGVLQGAIFHGVINNSINRVYEASWMIIVGSIMI